MLDNFRIESAAVSDRGLSEKRPQNEDSFLEIPNSGIFAVADGVGGAQAGEVASQMAMEILGEAFTNVTDRTDAEDVMQVALERANSAIHQMSNELPQLAKMATTVVALHIAGNIATIGHVGDSRLYRLGANGTAYRETDDHSMVAEEVRAGRMTEEQADNHPAKNIISRALGAEPTVQIDLKTMMVEPNNTFLICSDGVTRHISDVEIADLLRTGGNPGVICQKIKELCFERGAEDNLTAVIVKLIAENIEKPVESSIIPETDADEVTVAAARPPLQNTISDDFDEDELLELDTAESMIPSNISDEPDVFSVHEAPVPEIRPEPIHALEPTYLATAETVANGDPFAEHTDRYGPPAAVPFEIPTASTPIVAGPVARVNDENVSTFGNTHSKSLVAGDRSSSAGKIATSVGLLLLGAVFGLGAYHFVFADRTAQIVSQPINEMRSSNEPRSAFEDNRRTLDKDPDAALKYYAAEPRDAEDYFLLGRAYLLTGKYPEGRKAFIESRNQIAAGHVDPTNAKTLQNEIAIGMAVTNDTGIQRILKAELEESKLPANTAANSNTNANR